MKRAGWRNVEADKKEATVVAALAAAAQQEAAVAENEALVAKAMQQALLLLGFRRGEPIDPTTRSKLRICLRNHVIASTTFPA